MFESYFTHGSELGLKEEWVNVIFTSATAGAVVKNLTANAGDRVRSLGWEDPLEKGKAWRSPWTV